MKLKHIMVALIALALASPTTALGAKPPTKRLTGSIDQWSALCNAAGLRLKGAQVEKVMLGTPAYYSGLRANDKILKCDVGDNSMKVTFEREGKQFGVNIATHPSAIQPGGASAARPAAALVSEPEALERLRDCDVVIFIDCSGSMGDKVDNESKWDWTYRRVQEFNTKYNQVAKRPITIVTFNHDFTIYPKATMKDVEAIFTRQRPAGGTQLAPPLAQIIAERMKTIKERPTVIAVLHDGIADDEAEVVSILERAANQLLHTDNLHVAFLQIGDDAGGASALRKFGNVDMGTQNVVDSHLFDEIKKNGLAPAMAASIAPRIVIPPVVDVPPTKPAPAKAKK
jgi:hypothetical protein